MNISEPFIRRPVATFLLMAGLAFLGLTALPRLPVAPLPQIDFPTILVTAALPGASPETMSSSVATPLERQFSQIAGVTEISSFSSLGATSITLQFDLDRNIDAASQDVQAAITAASKTLPRAMAVPPTYKKLDPSDAPILMLSARSDTLPMTVVDEYADNFLAQQIAQVPGVAQVALGGEQKTAIRVQVDPSKLTSSGLTLEDVRAGLTTTTTDEAKGSLTGNKTSFTIIANDQLTEAPQYEDVVLSYHDGRPVRVRDVGRAISAPTDRYAAAFHDNDPAIILSISKQPGANIIDTVTQIKALLPQLIANIPPAIKITTILDRTTTVRASMAEVQFTLALAIGLVILVLFVFVRNLWCTVISGLTILLSLLGAFAIMYVLGFSLDNLSLMALTIAIGFIVDDAIVVVENIYRHIEAGESPLRAALIGSREIWFTVLSISVSLVAVFIPLLFMGGIVGRLFREFALTVTASIAVSAVVSLTLAPTLCARYVRSRAVHSGPRGRSAGSLGALSSFYERTLDIVLRHQAATLGVFLVTLGVTGFLAIQTPKGFFPIQDTGMLQGFAETAQDASPEEMMRLQRDLGEILLKDPDIAGFASQTGNIGGNGNAQTANTARFWIALKPREARKRTATEIIDRLRPQLARVKGASLTLRATQDINVGGGGARARGNFQYTIQSPTLDELAEWSKKLLEKIRTLPQIAEASSDLLANAPQVRVVINRDSAARFGITPSAIDNTLNDAYGQRQVTQYYTQLDTHWVVLEVTPELQGSFASLDRLYIRSPLTGAAVPLSTLVTVDSSPVGTLSVTHQDQFPSVQLSFSLKNGVALSQAVDAILRATGELKMPSSVVAKFTGTAREFQTSLSDELILVLSALVVVYIILGILYESIIHPITILSTLPSAGIGALIALRAGNMDLSIIGIIGIILLIGIVKKNGIMLVDFAIAASRDRSLPPLLAVREACLLRLRPILMTTAAALLAALPLAISSGTGSELRQPLGYAMVGGLLLSQVLTLYTTPVVYLYLDRLQIALGRRPGQTAARSSPHG
jgi:HAE1 family hydrophobic/amphiphilic exporter-1